MRSILERRRFVQQAAALFSIAILSLAGIAAGGLASVASASEEQAKIEGVVAPRAAPQWDIAEWINSDAGNVDALKGKVIVIDFFQLWCPGCNQFSGPLMQAWQERFAEEIAAGDLVLLKIHTVFEGHEYQNVQRLKAYLKEKGVTMPVGVDRHVDGDHRPATMRRYRTRGTPEMVMIDRQGMIRFQHFAGFDHVAAEKFLEQLIGVKTASPRRAKPLEICLASELCG